jgi:uncharacterized membrane protein
LSLAGLGISIYLTIVHFDTSVVLSCPAGGGIIDCAKVTTSPESHILGIPVAVLGLANYFAMTILNSPWVWKRPERWIAVTRFVLVIAGMAFVLWLIAAEVLIIGNICLWCTGVHVVTFALLVVLTRVAPRQLGWSTYES